MILDDHLPAFCSAIKAHMKKITVFLTMIRHMYCFFNHYVIQYVVYNVCDYHIRCCIL